MDTFFDVARLVLEVVGALALIAGALICLIRRFETLWDLTVARILKLIEPVYRHVGSYRLRADIQGHANSWIDHLNRRLPLGLGMPKIRVRFHDAESSLRLLESGELLLLFDWAAPSEENYSRAVKWVVGAIALPHHYRPFIPIEIVEAFELSVARMMLRDQNPEALASFMTHAYQPAVSRDQRVARYCLRFETIDDAGFFSRILWPELDDFGRRHVGRHPTDSLKDEVAAFTLWLHDMAARRKGARTPLRFESAGINVAFHLIRDEAKDLPLSTYEGFIGMELDRGFPRVYVLARGASIALTRILVRRFRGDERVRAIKIYEYDQVLMRESILDEALRGDIELPREDERHEYRQRQQDEAGATLQEEQATRQASRLRVRAVCGIIYNSQQPTSVGLKETAEVFLGEEAT